MKTLIRSNNRLSLRCGFFTLTIALCWFALSPAAHAVSPPPDGAYPGGNTAEGNSALRDLTTGQFNTAVGIFSLTLNTGGNSNTGVGASALRNNTTGDENTAIGADALRANKTGVDNTATGWQALFQNTEGDGNTANGANALLANRTGFDNTAIGASALSSNTTGILNTAVGTFALFDNVDGSDNNAVGDSALLSNVSGTFNNAHGRSALSANDGSENNAFGDLAMENNVSGVGNTAIGDDALRFNVDGSFNVAVGDEAGTGLGASVNNCIAIGAPGEGPFATFDNTCFIGSIFGEEVSDPATQVPVYVDQFNVVGVFNTSSRKLKHDIQPMDKASETLYRLKPVTFRFNSDWKGTKQYGLIAEEVAEVDPQLVVHSKNGEVTAVHYEQINNMLLNEFLKEHKKVEELKSDFQATVAKQQKEIQTLTARLEEQAAQIQRVSAQLAAASPSRGGLEASKFATGRIRRGGPAPQVVNNP
jgi:trimeric autotransporter adhesin